MAVADVNSNNSLLGGNKLVLHMLDTNCSAFQGAAAAIELLKKNVVAIIGPQTSAVSHFVAHVGAAIQVPFITYAATDPSLSESQYPFLFRIAHTDAVQMEVVASLIDYYGWREVVILYLDDDFGGNGASSLSDALINITARVVQKAALPPDIDKYTLGNILARLVGIQTRIFVVHMPQNLASMLFAEARNLGMMSAGYVWIVTDSYAGTWTSLDASTNVFGGLQGVIGIQGYYQNDTLQFKSFLSGWNFRFPGSVLPHLYGLYAYDSVWFLVHALKAYLLDHSNVTFHQSALVPNGFANSSDMAHLNVFEGGSSLRTHLLQTNFQGVSGRIQVGPNGDLVRSEFEILNVVGHDLRVVGYWTTNTQLSVFRPGNSMNASSNSLGPDDAPHTLLQVVWPGSVTKTPRGWVLPKNGRPLKIAVPNKAGFKQFVSWSGNSSNVFNGFCIDVFQMALNYLPYSVPYTFVPFGINGPPVYDDMIDRLAEKIYDAVVGDLTITTKRMEKVDFSQPYVESGLVVVVPFKDANTSNEWAFLRPFTTKMWITTFLFFIFTGMVIWMLEHKKNRDFRGKPKKQVVTLLWFTFSTLFFSQREKTKSACGRFVLLVWLFVVLIITSSYTANLTSILTVQQLIPTIQGITSLQSMNVPVGYQAGSFARDYLISINIAKERLKPLSNMAEYERALNQGPNGGGVAAIVDEVPYVQAFLSSYCGFTIAGQVFTKSGWGFVSAFPKDSELAVDMSTAILSMSENGEMQKIHDLWLSSKSCDSGSTQVQSNKLDLGSFWGLFLITGLASLAGLLIYIIRLFCAFVRKGPPDNQEESVSRSARFLKSFAAYAMEAHPSASEKGGSTHGSKKGKNHGEDGCINESKLDKQQNETATSQVRVDLNGMQW
ncbi:hypothetical protein KP509_17G036400 [Ceratopteris richardii]|uniref:Glutamate receptor n=1 Tax=Ceratopteris richardii TaxID=49495 RepID=A0A8T2SX31_CERRI|nr:hypothetical protein KP509_17G036400 [Ceratopteris richardii]